VKLVLTALALVALMAGGALADACVDVFFEAPSIVHPGETVTVSGGITNCGDAAGIAVLTAELTYNGEIVPCDAEVAVPLAAGETKAYSLEVTIPADVPVGVYELCVTAELDGATDTECGSVEVGGTSVGRKARRPGRTQAY